MDSTGYLRTRLNTPPWYYSANKLNLRRYRHYYDPNFYSLDDKALREFYGWDKRSWADPRAHGLVRRPARTKKPDWNVSPKGEDIYRPADPSWKGAYEDENYDLINPRINGKPNSNKQKVHHGGNEYRYTAKQQHGDDGPTIADIGLAVPRNIQDGGYMNSKGSKTERLSYNQQENDISSAARNVTERLYRNGKAGSKEERNNYLPHVNDKNIRSIHRQTNNNGISSIVSDEKRILSRKELISTVGSKVDAFNEAYVPLGGDKYYPTFDLRWRTKPKVDSRWDNGNEINSKEHNSMPEIGTSTDKIAKFNEYDLQTSYDDSKFVFKRPWNSSKYARSLAYERAPENKRSRRNQKT